MMRATRCSVSSRIVGGALAWLMFVGAPLTQVSSQQDVDEVDDGDIVLPTVILELDEPASGGLEVALPIDIQVLAPERWPPLPEAGDLDIDLRSAVAAPDIDLVISEDDAPEHTLVAETFVSIGTTFSGGEGIVPRAAPGALLQRTVADRHRAQQRLLAVVRAQPARRNSWPDQSGRRRQAAAL